MIWFLLAVLGLALAGSVGLTLYLTQVLTKKLLLISESKTQSSDLDNLDIILNTHLRDVNRKVDAVPDKVLQSIKGSNNVQKGKLGELIAYLSLKAEYDKLIIVNDVVDFIGIKFPTDTEEGKIVFMDIKTGKHARLSKDQKAVQKLVKDQVVAFKTIKVDDSDVTN